MKHFLPLLSFLLAPAAPADTLPEHAREAAEHAVRHHDAAQVELLSELVRFKTVNEPGTANAEHPEFRAFAAHVGRRARDLGLDFSDLGAVLVVSLGENEKRLGVVTHGDVQPADPAKWNKSPFELDAESEPGRLIARGAEDNKSPIATAMYAMKAIKELGLPMTRRIELIIALTEESNWAPFEETIARHPPPEMNIAIDSQYPVVVAEKGWGSAHVTFEADADKSNTPSIAAYEGGAFLSQVPENARIVIRGIDDEFAQSLEARIAERDDGVEYRIEQNESELTLHAKGRAAHSASPENGLNALTHAAALLDDARLLHTPAGQAVDFVNMLIGTGVHGKLFGKAAYAHDFMGPLTVNLSTARMHENGLELAINTRAPAGKPSEQLDREMREAIAAWAKLRGIEQPTVKIALGEAYLPKQPPQVEPLLTVFRHYTGMEDAKPTSIGGGTHARLLPNAVNFGPSMPGVPYTGHSEHEFITSEQMTLNLRMYTAMLAWLATQAD